MKESFNNVLQVMKFIVRNSLNKGSNFIDATIGNGNDFVFMKKIVGDNGIGYGFDIQKEAIKNTTLNIEKNGITLNSIIIESSHENIDKYVKTMVDVCVFNLGYLPNGNHDIITKPESTIRAIKKVLELLNVHGKIVISAYIAHEGGLIEYEKLIYFLESLDQRKYSVSRLEFINQKNLPPKLIIIEKREIKHKK